MKLLVFGTGDCYIRYKRWLGQSEIVALMDNSFQKQNTKIDGIKVVAPNEGVRLSFDCVVIMSFYVKEMKRQLVELGVDECKIYHFYDLRKLVQIDALAGRPQCFGIDLKMIGKSKDRKILLLSRDMTLGGPAIALFHAAEVLKKQGWQVVFASMFDGALREKILEIGIPVIVDDRLQLDTMREIGWTTDFSVILCNTNNYYIFLSDRDNRIPVIWWLHDSLFFYEGMDRNVLKNIDRENLYTVSVGPVPEKAIQTYLPFLQVGRLLYGVEDVCPIRKEYVCEEEKIVFVTIGYIEARKGQDILIQAIEKLPDEIKRKTVFYLIGQNSSLMAQEIQSRIQSMPEVIMTGTMRREEINTVLDKADMLICPSREDPMPTVAAEAMMHGVPCLVSDSAGTAAYIHARENGLIFPAGDVDALSREILWCMEHQYLLKDMGKKARRIYEEFFSMEAFRQALLEWIESASGNCVKR